MIAVQNQFLNKKVVIGVLTAAKFADRRRGAEFTCGRDVLANPDVDIVFLIGDPSAKMPRREGQTPYLPCPDDYESLLQKTRWFCLWALAYTDASWLLKCDDDTYVHVGRLLAALDAGDWSQPIVGCQDGNGDHFHCSPVRMRLLHDAFRMVPAEAQITIPRVLPQIWLGGQPIPEHLAVFRQSWAALHPAWEMKLWTETNLPPLVNQALFDKTPTPAQKCHIARYEILHREGGVYVDFDVECRRPIDDLLFGLPGFAAAEEDDAVGVAVIGAIPGDELLGRVIAGIPNSMKRPGNPPGQTGSWFWR